MLKGQNGSKWVDTSSPRTGKQTIPDETGSVSGKKNSIPAYHPTFFASQTSLKITRKSSLTGKLPGNFQHCLPPAASAANGRCSRSVSCRRVSCFDYRNLVRLYRYQLAGDAPLTAAALERAMRGRGRRRLVRKGARPAAGGSAPARAPRRRRGG